MLKSHAHVVISTLDRLSKKQAQQFSKPLHALKGLPWKIALLIDSTLPSRASLHPEHAKKFNHGNGFVIGHQWTHIVLLLHDRLIPLRPIPDYRKRYGLDHHRADQTAHDLVVESLHHGTLDDDIGPHDPREVLV